MRTSHWLTARWKSSTTLVLMQAEGASDVAALSKLESTKASSPMNGGGECHWVNISLLLLTARCWARYQIPAGLATLRLRLFNHTEPSPDGENPAEEEEVGGLQNLVEGASATLGPEAEA